MDTRALLSRASFTLIYHRDNHVSHLLQKENFHNIKIQTTSHQTLNQSNSLEAPHTSSARRMDSFDRFKSNRDFGDNLEAFITA
jgi:hypothetical protein